MSTAPTWVPADACTLPTPEQPLRVTEFATLFAASLREVRRTGDRHLRLALCSGPGVEATARELAARETRCCSFFRFAVSAGAGTVVIDVGVPPSRTEVLDGLQRQAESALTPRPPTRVPDHEGAP
ncbi:hypothetical protein [Georgenia sp. H159]|uniref:hypothetical protein n=1 Tax=Georgenia sp. H159 TaxID=3076115 RepID=UPI002D77E09C|nr:hypothetical protein [Georgenia sp. H159]